MSILKEAMWDYASTLFLKVSHVNFGIHQWILPKGNGCSRVLIPISIFLILSYWYDLNLKKGGFVTSSSLILHIQPPCVLVWIHMYIVFLSYYTNCRYLFMQIVPVCLLGALSLSSYVFLTCSMLCCCCCF